MTNKLQVADFDVCEMTSKEMIKKNGGYEPLGQSALKAFWTIITSFGRALI